MAKLFSGTYTAIITPFTLDNQVDWNSLSYLVEKQVEAGVDGIVFVGTTGESPTLSHDEHYEILSRSVEMVNGRTQVIHGTGSNNTKECLDFANVAKKAGADGQLVVNPYYNKPTQEGLYQHFSTIADNNDLPIIVYNIKGRSGVNLETDTLMRLTEHKNIVAVKEASGDISQMMDVINESPEDFSVLVGDDSMVLPFMAAGGDGVISVISNALPATFSQLIDLCLREDIESARELFYITMPIMKALTAETNPIPIKEFMAMLHEQINPDMRLPMCRAQQSTLELLNEYVGLARELEEASLEVRSEDFSVEA